MKRSYLQCSYVYIDSVFICFVHDESIILTFTEISMIFDVISHDMNLFHSRFLLPTVIEVITF